MNRGLPGGAGVPGRREAVRTAGGPVPDPPSRSPNWCPPAFTAIFPAAPIVLDREFEFLREMLVAQVKVGDRYREMPRRRDGFRVAVNHHSGTG